jgi:hypothetical protein
MVQLRQGVPPPIFEQFVLIGLRHHGGPDGEREDIGGVGRDTARALEHADTRRREPISSRFTIFERFANAAIIHRAARRDDRAYAAARLASSAQVQTNCGCTQCIAWRVARAAHRHAFAAPSVLLRVRRTARTRSGTPHRKFL